MGLISFTLQINHELEQFGPVDFFFQVATQISPGGYGPQNPRAQITRLRFASTALLAPLPMAKNIKEQIDYHTMKLILRGSKLCYCSAEFFLLNLGYYVL